MAEYRIIVELTTSRRLQSFSASTRSLRAATLDTKLVPKLPGIEWDESYPAVKLPTVKPLEDAPTSPHAVAVPFAVDDSPQSATYIVRGTAKSEADLEALQAAAIADPNVVGVFSDVKLQPTLICPGSPPLGNDQDVERLLCTAALRKCGMDGSGVLVAIVDTGINIEYLLLHGKRPNFDAARSWVPVAGLVPGHLPVNHGTMCAYDVTIAAPNCTLLDIALLRSQQEGETFMSGLLSDAVLAYRHLLDIQLAPRRPGEGGSLVVNNSWGMFHPSWDFPVGNPGNYSDNPNHPFNRIVGALARAGADIVFAAGNCGANCPDGRCQGVTAMAIYGANSHEDVYSVAGVDTDKNRVGYSAIGPGRLSRLKPDISGYTHFKGSGVYSADGGTSAAAPVVAGVVAAVRSKLPYDPSAPASSPAAIRNMLIKTAEDRGMVGYDFEYGWGIVNGCRIAELHCKKEEPPKPEKCCCECEDDCGCHDHYHDCDCGCGHHHHHHDCGCGHHHHHKRRRPVEAVRVVEERQEEKRCACQD